MPAFEPFAALRYDTDRVDLADVMAPPYDVIDDDGRAALESRSPYNAVRVDLPRDAADHDRYAEARCLLEAWESEGVLVRDNEPGFYVYRMGFHDPSGRARQTAGVIGAMEVAPTDGTPVLPHEHTMSKPKDDRLNMRRACRADLSAIWGLSVAEGLGGLCELPGPPLARATDTDGVHHRIWRITQPGIIDAVRQAVESEPVLIADGHHRYETALAHKAECDADGGPGAHDLLMTYIVELSDQHLAVRPIHRMLTGSVSDLADQLSSHYAVEPIGVADPASIEDRMAEAGGSALVIGGDAWLLIPHDGAFDGVADLDTARLDHALAAIDDAPELTYQHGADNAVALVDKGAFDAAVLVRPATVAQIAATARGGERMPPKTTFFHPKPRTGLLFRPLD